MKCPFCTSIETRVVDKRGSEKDISIRRRRECLRCEKRFTTYERFENSPLRIIKKDGTRQEFDKSKVLKGLIRACEKRPVTQDMLDQLIMDLEADLRNIGEGEASTKMIGELLMKRLKKLDKVSYIRFASVYREFADVEDFNREVNKLMPKKR